MAKFILLRSLSTLALMWVVSVLIFLGAEILPGDPAQIALGMFATEDSVAALREEMGLNRPAIERYFDWLGGAVQGDFGRSLVTKMDVSAFLGERVRNTTILAGVTTLISVPLAITIGLTMAMYAGSAWDRGFSVIVLAFSATPEFLIGTLAVLFFAVQLGWLPAVAYLTPGASFGRTAGAMAMPVLTLTLVLVAQMARMTRAVIANTLGEPYVEMATLKGVPFRRVVWRHALVNSIGPIANVVALNIAYLISGVIVVETVFAYPGLARFMIDAVHARDMPLIQAGALIFCASYVILVFIADLIGRLSDPRAAHHRPGDNL
ncbi:MAG: ABC transporter permease [Pikeienuella sp.]